MFKEGGLKVVKYGSSGEVNKPDEGQTNGNMLLSNPWIQRWRCPRDPKLGDDQESELLGMYLSICSFYVFSLCKLISFYLVYNG